MLGPLSRKLLEWLGSGERRPGSAGGRAGDDAPERASAGDSLAWQFAPDDLAAGVLGLDTPTVGEVFDEL